MACRRNLLGKLEFSDDEPVELDCECGYAYAGEDYNVVTFEFEGKKQVVCTCDEHLGDAVFERLRSLTKVSVNEEHVNTADDEYDDYCDYLSDQDD